MASFPGLRIGSYVTSLQVLRKKNSVLCEIGLTELALSLLCLEAPQKRGTLRPCLGPQGSQAGRWSQQMTPPAATAQPCPRVLPSLRLLEKEEILEDT